MNVIHPLCSSHVETPERIVMLERAVMSMCKSIDQFVIKRAIRIGVTRPRISVSSSSHMHQSIVHFSKRMRDVYGVYIYICTENKGAAVSQLEHYRFLSETIKERRGWCMFFDDDDYSAPCRVQAYAQAIAYLLESRTHRDADKVGSVFCGGAELGVVHPRSRQMSLLELDEVASSIRRGEKENAEVGNEYFMFVMRFHVLYHFTHAVCPPRLLRDKECDLLLRNYASMSYAEVPHVLWRNWTDDGRCWLYAHCMALTDSRRVTDLRDGKAKARRIHDLWNSIRACNWQTQYWDA